MSASGEQLSFEQDIKPLFREGDRQAMEWAFDLWSYNDVAGNSDAILERLRKGHDAVRRRLARRPDRDLSRLGRRRQARLRLLLESA